MSRKCPTCKCANVGRRRRRFRDKVLLQRRYACQECHTLYSVTMGLFKRTLEQGFHCCSARKR